MPQVTANKAIPYAAGTDFSDPRVLRDLALTEDAAFAAYDVAFAAGPRPPAFMCRSSASGIAISNGTVPAIVTSVVEWNTSGGGISASGTWTQSLSDAPSWWMFGLNIFESQATGTGTVGTAMQAVFIVTSLDPVTGLASTTALGDGQPTAFGTNNYSTETTETATGSHWFTGFTILPMYKGLVVPVFGSRDSSGAQTKQPVSGTVFWGVKLGAV
jgi:hypothetical protein